MTRDARLSGEVRVRPIRLGLVLRLDDRDAYLEATSFASGCWGGLTFPIFSTDVEPDELQRSVVRLGVDARVGFGDEERAASLATSTGSEWIGYGSPTTSEAFGRPLDVRALAKRVRPVLEPRRGSIDAAQSILWSTLWRRSGGWRRGRHIRLTRRRTMAGGLAAGWARWVETTQGVRTPRCRPRGSREASTILIRFWNWRSVGAQVIPWVPGSVR